MSTASVDTRTTGAPSGALDPDHALRAMYADWRRIDQLAGALDGEADRITSPKAKRTASALLAYLYRRLDAIERAAFACTAKTPEGTAILAYLGELIGTEESEAQSMVAVRRSYRAMGIKPSAPA